MGPLSKIPINSIFQKRQEKSLQQVIDQVVCLIGQRQPITSLYCFGMQSKNTTEFNLLQHKRNASCSNWHLYLLLTSEDIQNNATANLMDFIQKESKGEISITLLCYSPKQIAAANTKHQTFFASIIQSGWLVHGKPSELADLKLTNLPELDSSSIARYSRTRFEIAGKLFESIPSYFDQPLVAGYILHTIMEQFCLGLLYAYLHYHPNHFHIQYLLQLCNLFTDLPEQLFFRNPNFSETLQKILSASYHDLRFRNTDIFLREDVEKLYELCLEFECRAEPLLKNRLSQLNPISNENTEE
jgi:hypothetical protein